MDFFLRRGIIGAIKRRREPISLMYMGVTDSPAAGNSTRSKYCFSLTRICHDPHSPTCLHLPQCSTADR